MREKIAEGGFGAVYRAEQPLLNRLAIIKVPLEAVAASPEYVTRFLREAQLASKLDHPYAAHIYAFGVEPDGTLWTAMELVRGTSLDQLIKQQGPLDLPRFVALFDKLCEVVHTAHEQGIVHRDLKPSNVMVLSRAGRLLPKLLDLGIAKGEAAEPGVDEASASEDNAFESLAGDARSTAIPTTTPTERLIATGTPASLLLASSSGTRHTRAGKYLGSPAYMAPEQWVDARKVDARSDIYALGVLAYEVLTGRLPFAETTISAVARQHARAPVPPLGAGLPSKLDAVIAKAMAKRSADRFATAIELAGALRSAFEDAQARAWPELPASLRQRFVGLAPQPLAEAVAGFDVVRNVHQAQAAAMAVGRVAARMVGAMALASWAAMRPEWRSEGGLAAAHRLAKAVRTNSLTDAAWIEAATALTADARIRRELFALPGLVDLFWEDQAPSPAADWFAQLFAAKTWFDEHGGAADPDLVARMGTVTTLLVQLLRGLDWLCESALLVGRDGAHESWNGVRRPHRPVVTIAGRASRRGEVVLVDADGGFALDLAPLMIVALPAPGQAEELFVIDGASRHGARMVSLPTGYEHTDDAALPWLREALGLDDEQRAEIAEQRPPYRGLETFTTADAAMFVGREQETEAFANRLRQEPFLVVVGPSGAGKSSFVQAGVMPALGSHWRSLTVRPGRTPLKTLCEALSSRPSPDSSPSQIAVAVAAEGGALLLYVDQFEELFTLCHDAGERERYVDALLAAGTLAGASVRVVLTVRDDFLLRCQQLPALRAQLGQRLQLLATPTVDDLQRILIEPAKRAGYRFEGASLVEAMVADVRDLPAALPLLSFTASRMWELRDRHAHVLTRQAYETLGGVGGALAQHAERVFGSMTPAQQRLVRMAFRNLVTAEGTRAVLSRAEILELMGSSADAEVALEQLIGARLLTGSEGQAGTDRVEVVHEALLGAWPRLIDWRREDAEGARVRDRLRASARAWNDRNEAKGLLWRGEVLTEYELWRARHREPLTGIEQRFADASLRDAARARRLRAGVLATIGALLTIGFVVALVLFRRAETQRGLAADNAVKAGRNEARANALVVTGNLANGQRAAAAGDAHRALIYLAEAAAAGAHGPGLTIPLAITRRVLGAERRVYRGHDKKVWGLTRFRDAQRYATAGADGVVNIWHVDQAQPSQTFKDATAGIYGTTLSETEALLAAPSFDGGIRVYELATGRRVIDGSHGDTMVGSAQFYDADRKLVSVGRDGGVKLWEVTSGRELAAFQATTTDAGTASLYAPAQLLAVPSFDRTIALWDLRTQQRVHTLRGHTDTPWDTAFSPDGKRLASAGWDNTVRLWDPITGALTATLIGHSAPVDIVRWSGTGAFVASGGRDGVVRVWNRNGQLGASLPCDRGLIYDIAWSGDETRLLTSCGDAAVVWDLSVSLPIARFQGHGAAIFRAVFAAASDQALSVGSDGAMRRWAIDSVATFQPAAHAGELTRVVACGGQSWTLAGDPQAGDQRVKRWTARGALAWTSPADWKVSDVTCDVAAGAALLGLVDGTVYAVAVASTESPREALLPRTQAPLLAVHRGTQRVVLIGDDGIPHIAPWPRTPGDAVARGTAAILARTWQPSVTWVEDGSAFVQSSDAGASVWDGVTGALRFEVPALGGTLRKILLDSASYSLFAAGADFTIRQYDLRSGELLGSYVVESFPWSLHKAGDRLWVGLDDASVVEFSVASRQRLRLLGVFSSDVINLAPEGNDLIWVGCSDRNLALVDLHSGAVLFTRMLPTEPTHLLSSASLAMVVGGLNGNLAFVALPNAPVDLAQLRDEARCRVGFVLDEGVLTPRSIDAEACGRIEASAAP